MMCDVQRGSRVCRRLFGPVDHGELRAELNARMREIEDEGRRRWDFDFWRGIPLPSSRYVWEESPGDTVPHFYRTPESRLRTHPAATPATSAPIPGTPETSERTPSTPETPRTPSTPTSEPPRTLTTPTPETPLTLPATTPKRTQPAPPITDFFPVRKKTKVDAALCDKLHPAPPIPTERTPSR